jgi:hypothetical protein
VPFRPLNAADVSAINAREVREAILGQTNLFPELAEGHAERAERWS